MSSYPSWRELCLRTPFSWPDGSAANRSMEAVGMIISWLYTGETASQIQGKAVWGEVPCLLAHGRVWSGHWDGGGPACEPAGTGAELAPPSSPPAVCCSSVPNQAIICFISLMTDSVCLRVFLQPGCSTRTNWGQIWINPWFLIHLQTQHEFQALIKEI